MYGRQHASGADSASWSALTATWKVSGQLVSPAECEGSWWRPSVAPSVNDRQHHSEQAACWVSLLRIGAPATGLDARDVSPSSKDAVLSVPILIAPTDIARHGKVWRTEGGQCPHSLIRRLIMRARHP